MAKKCGSDELVSGNDLIITVNATLDGSANFSGFSIEAALLNSERVAVIDFVAQAETADWETGKIRCKFPRTDDATAIPAGTYYLEVRVTNPAGERVSLTPFPELTVIQGATVEVVA